MDLQETARLRTLMIERNQLLDLLDMLDSMGGMQNNDLTESVQFFRTKIKQNQHQLNEEARGMQCAICNAPSRPEDEMLACSSCGSPIHASHTEDFVVARDCPICMTQLFLEMFKEFQTIKPNFQLSLQKKLNWNRQFSFKTKSVINSDAKPRVRQRFTCAKCGKPINQKWNHCKWCGEKVEK